MNTKFHNDDLTFDISDIQSFDVPITVAKSFDDDMDNKFALDVEDSSYWYANENDRDNDFELLKTIVPQFSFIHI